MSVYYCVPGQHQVSYLDIVDVYESSAKNYLEELKPEYVGNTDIMIDSVSKPGSYGILPRGTRYHLENFESFKCCTCCQRNGTLTKYLKKFVVIESSGSSSSGCFIATACFNSAHSPEVIRLRKFRDRVLLKNFFGMMFIKIYYLLSPPIASAISRSNIAKRLVIILLINPLSGLIQDFNTKKGWY